MHEAVNVNLLSYEWRLVWLFLKCHLNPVLKHLSSMLFAYKSSVHIVVYNQTCVTHCSVVSSTCFASSYVKYPYKLCLGLTMYQILSLIINKICLVCHVCIQCLIKFCVWKNSQNFNCIQCLKDRTVYIFYTVCHNTNWLDMASKIQAYFATS